MDTKQIQKPVIWLERDENNPSHERLAGINGDEIEIRDEVATAVRGCRRYFSYVVDVLAENRLRAEQPEFRRLPNTPPAAELLAHKGMVRDELLQRLGSLSTGTKDSPYFVR